MKLYEPDPETPKQREERYMAEHGIPKPKRRKLPRCVCGCNRAARWPMDGRPVFHTRLCGYLMALKMLGPKKASAK